MLRHPFPILHDHIFIPAPERMLPPDLDHLVLPVTWGEDTGNAVPEDLPGEKEDLFNGRESCDLLFEVYREGIVHCGDRPAGRDELPLPPEEPRGHQLRDPVDVNCRILQGNTGFGSTEVGIGRDPVHHTLHPGAPDHVHGLYRTGHADRGNGPVKTEAERDRPLEGDVYIERDRGERNLLETSRHSREGRTPAEGAGPDAHDILHAEVLPDPVRRVIGVVDQERSAPDIRIPETADEDRGGTALVAGGWSCHRCCLGMEPADNRAAGKAAQAFSLALSAPHHSRTTSTRPRCTRTFPLDTREREAARVRDRRIMGRGAPWPSRPCSPVPGTRHASPRHTGPRIQDI